jgi:hypothetical protein
MLLPLKNLTKVVHFFDRNHSETYFNNIKKTTSSILGSSLFLEKKHLTIKKGLSLPVD